MIKVVNGFKHGKFESSDTVYIGRPGKGLRGSPLANPFKLTSEEARPEVIQRYRCWLFQQLRARNSPQYDELLRIKELEAKSGVVHLACFCKPKCCHGDIVKAALECGAYC